MMKSLGETMNCGEADTPGPKQSESSRRDCAGISWETKPFQVSRLLQAAMQQHYSGRCTSLRRRLTSSPAKAESRPKFF
jgi:hypothetical protein